MNESEKLESCLKVVANRCRNLRKAIERAKTWDRAAKQGQSLNDEQMRSVQSIEAKETLLAELQEILKKQTAIIQPDQFENSQAATGASKRRAKAERAAKVKEVQTEKESTSSAKSSGMSDEGKDQTIPEVPKQVEDKVSNSTVPDQEGQLLENEENEESFQQVPDAEAQDGTDDGVKASLALSETPAFSMSRDTEDVRKQMDAMQLQHTEHLNRDRKEAIRMTLNLFHVVDFLRQNGSREALLAFFESPDGQRCARRVDNLDMDLLCYFNVMLTSPNGNVPHNEAVDVSTAHCLEFLKGSMSSAFKGTSYSKLSEIATTIGSCQILTERGLQDEGRQSRGRRKSRTRGKPEASSNGSEPSHLISDPAADLRLT